jgi:hypothetical protein
LSCHAEPSGDGRHRIVVNNGHSRPVLFDFGDSQTAQAATALRHTLYDTHLDEQGQPRHRIGSFGQPEKNSDAYVADLRRLAGIGARVYRALLSDPTDEGRLRAWLTDSAAEDHLPPVIQVARSRNSRLSLPWQLLYDEPLDEGPAEAAVCPSVQRWGPGSPYVAAPAVCPWAHTHDIERGTICPFGFWGLANVIETPPTTMTRLLPRSTGTHRPAQLIAAVDETLVRDDEHLDRLGVLLGNPKFPVAASWQQLRTEAVSGSDVLYVFCHGVLDGEEAVLSLGSQDPITPDGLEAWATSVQWAMRRPLVVLNGCSTGEMLPDLLADFVDAFVNSLQGAGVVATEIAVESRAGQYAAEVLLSHLWRGQTAGNALREMRWELLCHGSVLGLAYTPYCDAFLSLPTAA